MRRLFICLIILVFWGFTSAAKADPLAVARAWIDWSNFEIQTTEGIMYVYWNGNVSIGTSAWNDWFSDEESSSSEEGSFYYEKGYDEWGDYYYQFSSNSLETSSVQGGANSIAQISNANRMFVSAETQDILGHNEAYADASWDGWFYVEGSGTITFSIPYHLEVSIQEIGDPLATSFIRISFDPDQYDCINCFEIGLGLGQDHYEEGPGWWSEDGKVFYYDSTFEYSLTIPDDNNYYSGYLEVNLNTHAESWSSPVPLPSALWFFGSGLFGVAGFRKFLGPGRKHS